ncbi:hypothetical protein TREMEDRAFT_65798 [Tremella mesenterica DSM 1558]|uniref:uncharacterized protein n=1 Tax=Tremella mesenterica (strain ATCC 24925 / CBS 8224 / DSM 1558 / NBRC 9311 / NRRL Y-6157 / RJB 2259-6 / UBC 559-6) TaxID=578456 RepID=UPI00032D34BB|nr:uncharacterized protein TREMEDRAFT_65798 [Tremella mesenterica DSM 1558]EIW66192.1 hypothetical protein TREMEDRAFT_65798 [Tremella mesenterica DSM 1558]
MTVRGRVAMNRKEWSLASFSSKSSKPRTEEETHNSTQDQDDTLRVEIPERTYQTTCQWTASDYPSPNYPETNPTQSQQSRFSHFFHLRSKGNSDQVHESYDWNHTSSSKSRIKKRTIFTVVATLSAVGAWGYILYLATLPTHPTLYVCAPGSEKTNQTAEKDYGIEGGVRLCCPSSLQWFPADGDKGSEIWTEDGLGFLTLSKDIGGRRSEWDKNCKVLELDGEEGNLTVVEVLLGPRKAGVGLFTGEKAEEGEEDVEESGKSGDTVRVEVVL